MSIKSIWIGFSNIILDQVLFAAIIILASQQCLLREQNNITAPKCLQLLFQIALIWHSNYVLHCSGFYNHTPPMEYYFWFELPHPSGYFSFGSLAFLYEFWISNNPP